MSRPDISSQAARLLDVATGKIPHLYAGLCPDSVSGPGSRDPACPACQAIAQAEIQLAAVQYREENKGRIAAKNRQYREALPDSYVKKILGVTPNAPIPQPLEAEKRLQGHQSK